MVFLCSFPFARQLSSLMIILSLLSSQTNVIFHLIKYTTNKKSSRKKSKKSLVKLYDITRNELELFFCVDNEHKEFLVFSFVCRTGAFHAVNCSRIGDRISPLSATHYVITDFRRRVKSFFFGL